MYIRINDMLKQLLLKISRQCAATIETCLNFRAVDFSDTSVKHPLRAIIPAHWGGRQPHPNHGRSGTEAGPGNPAWDTALPLPGRQGVKMGAESVTSRLL